MPFVTSHRELFFFFLANACSEKCCKDRRRLDAPPVRGFQWQDRNHFRKHEWEEAFKSPSAFYSLSRVLFAAIAAQIGPKAVMRFSVFILEMFVGFGQRNLKKG